MDKEIMSGNLRFAAFIVVALSVFVFILRVVLRTRIPRPPWPRVLTTAFIVTVGGMFFAYMALRPAAADLSPSDRLPLWGRAFAKFFPWVWLAVLVLLASGYWMVFVGFGGFAGVGLHIHVMQATGIVMMLLFGHLYFAPYKRLRVAIAAGELAAAAAALASIRKTIAINLVLGVVPSLVGVSGGVWL